MFLDFECLLACLQNALVGRKSEERRLYGMYGSFDCS